MSDLFDLHEVECRAMPASDGLAAPEACSTETELKSSTDEQRIRARPKKGTFLDETVDFADPEGDHFARQIIEVLDDAKPRKRKRHAVDEANHLCRVRSVLANGLSCDWHREAPLVAFFRGAEGYSEKLHRPDWLAGGPLAILVDDLAEVGLVDATTGVEGIASSYAVTARLLSIAEAFGISLASLRRTVPRQRLVRTYTQKPKREWDVFDRKLRKGRGTEILFEPTAETEAWTEALASYNAFISQQRVEVAHLADCETLWIDHLNEDEDRRGARFKRPDILRTDVYRVFNDDSLEAPTFQFNGRLVGAWWMSVPKQFRPLITINGQPTVELDYSACHPRMLYHENGLEGPADPYELPEVWEFAVSNGLKPEDCRGCIKWLMQVIINGRGRADRAKRPKGLTIPDGFPLANMVRMVEASHAPIAAAFNTGAGLRLMRDESDIALTIVSTATEQGWPVLSVHDSFLATEDNDERLKSLMEKVYMDRKGRKPIIG